MHGLFTLKNPSFVTRNYILEEIRIIFNVFKSISTAIHSMFLLLGGKDFWHHFSTHLFHAQIVVQNLTLSLLMLASSEIARLLSRRSPRTILATFSTYSSVFAVEGRPDFGSSPTYSLPSLNFLNHSKTCVTETGHHTLLSTNCKVLWQIFQVL